MDTVLVNGEGNLDGSGLSVGEDEQGKKYRTVVYVDLENFDISEYHELYYFVYISTFAQL